MYYRIYHRRKQRYSLGGSFSTLVDGNGFFDHRKRSDNQRVWSKDSLCHHLLSLAWFNRINDHRFESLSRDHFFPGTLILKSTPINTWHLQGRVQWPYDNDTEVVITKHKGIETRVGAVRAPAWIWENVYEPHLDAYDLLRNHVIDRLTPDMAMIYQYGGLASD